MFLLYSLGRCPQSGQMTLPEGCADMASAKSQETRFPPGFVPDFLGDPMGEGSGRSFLTARAPEPSVP